MAGQQAVSFYREGDEDPDALSGQTVAVVGYGNLGRSMALNLRDSGLAVSVGNADDSYRPIALADGFEVAGIAEAVAAADVVYVLIPDEVIPEVFREQIGPSLRAGTCVCFASGYVLAFGLVTPPPGVDVLLLAPRMLGEEVRRTYLEGRGFLSYVSVEQDATGKAKARLLGLARAAGSLRRGAMELTAQHEALLDLFVEQGFGAYLGVALQSAFQVGAQAGLPAEAMVVELYMSGEMARTLQAFADNGFFRSVTWHGLSAAFGGFLRTTEIDMEAMQRHFREILEDIRSGGFARRFQEEQAGGYPSLAAIEAITSGDDPMTKAEERVRAALGEDRTTASEQG
ncbi:MAG TPA: NAD(P)-binding domain-containing protein [Actinomycetota bacterium]|nr:NAD(P)-binding domain-containing protein [Actinomycetota bacterium]